MKLLHQVQVYFTGMPDYNIEKHIKRKIVKELNGLGFMIPTNDDDIVKNINGKSISKLLYHSVSFIYRSFMGITE